MKKLLLGVAIGLVFGLGVSAVAAFADFGIWTKTGQYLDKPEMYQYGYEQGAWDAYVSVGLAHNKGIWDWDYFSKQMTCWDSETSKASEMHNYGQDAAHRSSRQGYSTDNFASILLASACGQ
jgi:hypothetical protein